jgi:signal peptidase I
VDLGNGRVQVLAYLGASFFAVNFGLPGLLSGGLNLYLAQPAIWLGLGFLCVRHQEGGPGLPAARLVSLALLAGAFCASLPFLAGVLYGFGYSTYAREPLHILQNLFYLGTMLWGLESARAYLLRNGGSSPAAGFLTVTLLFALVSLPFAIWEVAAAGPNRAFEVTGERLLPEIGESAVATMLAVAGGPWLAIAFRAAPLTVEWMSPVLPDLEWTIAGAAGILGSAGAYLGLRDVAGHDETASAAERRAVPGWLMALTAVVAAVIWLNTGLLGVRPALVSGISMEPNLVVGDIVVTREVPPSSLAVGDIVRFTSGSVPILHRVIKIDRGRDGMVLTTKGDNNNVADAPVEASRVEGKVVLTIPRAGLIPVKLKTWLSR